jgi:hypothetical protein
VVRGDVDIDDGVTGRRVNVYCGRSRDPRQAERLSGCAFRSSPVSCRGLPFPRCRARPDRRAASIPRNRTGGATEPAIRAVRLWPVYRWRATVNT